MTRESRQRLDDILAAAAAICARLRRGGLEDGLVFDAVRVRSIEIGEAVKGLDQADVESEPHIPWTDIAEMREILAHRYFDTSHAMVQVAVSESLPVLVTAVHRPRERT